MKPIEQIPNVKLLQHRYHSFHRFCLGLIFSESMFPRKPFSPSRWQPGRTFYRELVSASLPSLIFEPKQTSPPVGSQTPHRFPLGSSGWEQLLLTLCSGVWSCSSWDETSWWDWCEKATVRWRHRARVSFSYFYMKHFCELREKKQRLSRIFQRGVLMVVELIFPFIFILNFAGSAYVSVKMTLWTNLSRCSER